MFIFATFLVVLVIYFVAFRWKRRRLYKQAHLIPGFEGYPLLGNIPKYYGVKTKDYMRVVFDEILDETTVTKAWIGPILCILTKDADCAHALFNSPHALKKPKWIYYGLNVPHGLLAGNGDEYEKHRKLISRAFSPTMLQQAIPIFSEKSKKCVDILSEKVGTQDFDVVNYLGTCAIEAFFAKNYDFNGDVSTLVNGFLNARELATKRMFMPWYNLKPVYQATAMGKKFDEFYNDTKSCLKKIMENARSNVETQQKGEILANIFANPKHNFSDEEIADEFATFIYVVSVDCS
jgi:cytochrome P450